MTKDGVTHIECEAKRTCIRKEKHDLGNRTQAAISKVDKRIDDEILSSQATHLDIEHRLSNLEKEFGGYKRFFWIVGIAAVLGIGGFLWHEFTSLITNNG